MPVLVQNKLIDSILRPLSRLTAGLPERARAAIFIAAGLLSSVMRFLLSSGVLELRLLYSFSFHCATFGVMILMLLTPQLKPVVFDRVLLIPWVGLTLFMLFSGIFIAYDYLPDTMMFLVGFPVFYVVAGNSDITALFRNLHIISDLSFLGMAAVSVLFFPVTLDSYAGFFTNPNGLGMYLAIPFAFSLGGLLSDRGRPRLILVKDLLVLAGSGFLIYACGARSAQLGCLLTCLAALLAVIYANRGKLRRHLVRLLVPAALVCAAALGAVIWFVSSNLSKDMSLNMILSGRLGVWSSYLKELGFFGHSPSYSFLVDLGAEFWWNDALRFQHLSAHMAVLQYAYNYGIPAGIFFLAFTLFSGVKCALRSLRHGMETRYGILPLLIVCVFAVITLFESGSGTLGSFLTFHYFVIQCVLLVKVSWPGDPEQGTHCAEKT